MLTRTHYPLLLMLLLGLVLLACPPMNRGGGGGDDDDVQEDDDDASDDDDAADDDDDGDCEDGFVEDCNGNCSDESYIGDLLCDDGTVDEADFNCAEFNWDEGDCDHGDDDDAGGCGADEVEDCNGNCVPQEWVGDGWCDDGAYEYPEGSGIYINLDCEEFEYDGGDCDPADCEDADLASAAACGWDPEDYYCSQHDAWVDGNPDYECLLDFFETWGCPDNMGDDPYYQECWPPGTWD
jgi:hypothetical protein